MEYLLEIGWVVLMALAAVGVVLFIKITRRRQGGPRHGVGVAVPVNPMSAEHASRLQRRYLWAVATVVSVILVFALVLAAAD